MATPITAGAGLWELRKILTGEAGVDLPLVPSSRGCWHRWSRACSPSRSSCATSARMVSGIFVAYRVALAALVVVAWLGLWDR